MARPACAGFAIRSPYFGKGKIGSACDLAGLRANPRLVQFRAMSQDRSRECRADWLGRVPPIASAALPFRHAVSANACWTCRRSERYRNWCCCGRHSARPWCWCRLRLRDRCSRYWRKRIANCWKGRGVFGARTSMAGGLGGPRCLLTARYGRLMRDCGAAIRMEVRTTRNPMRRLGAKHFDSGLCRRPASAPSTQAARWLRQDQ